MAPIEQAIESALEHVVPRIKDFLEHRSSNEIPGPFKLLLSGLQGSGKSTWAAALATALRDKHGYKIVVVSLDDFYHSHENLVEIRNENANNKMLRTRGQPGTHDEVLAQDFFSSFGTAQEIRVPAFDKSQFNGEGDRMPVSEWHAVSNKPPVDVLIFEGWCVGFSALSESQLAERWSRSTVEKPASDLSDRCSTTVLRDHPFEHVRTINNNLKRYNETFMNPVDFQYLIHLDTDDLANVYRWRIDQEHAMWAAKGRGMTDEAVIEFVRGYMPAYELYMERLQREPFVSHSAQAKTQLKITLDVQRNVTGISEL